MVKVNFNKKVHRHYLLEQHGHHWLTFSSSPWFLYCKDCQCRGCVGLVPVPAGS